MIWLTWRQHRKAGLFAVVGLAVLAAVLIPTGLQMHNAFADTGLADCLRGLGQAELVERSAADTCEPAATAFERAYQDRIFPAALLVFLPLLAGMFWGAALVAREVEHGTHRLVWTQGVTRLRWLLVKVGLVTAGAVTVAAGYALLTSWWLTPLVRAGTSWLEFPLFDIYGAAPVGYTLFAVALGVLAGTMSRKVMPAMTITLVGFVAARVAMAIVRPRLQAPAEQTYPITADVTPNRFRGDLVLSEGVYDEAGNLLEQGGTAFCDAGPAGELPPPADSGDGGLGCSGYNAWTYQPGDRFWLFQYLETGIFVGLAVLLVLLAIYRVRRRIS